MAGRSARRRDAAQHDARGAESLLAGGVVWSLGAGLLLLVPRQWPAAGIAFGFAMLFHVLRLFRRGRR
jgi:hypothetical protein